MFITDEKLKQMPYENLPVDFDVSSWEQVQAFLEELVQHDVSTIDNLETMLLKYSDLLKCMADELSWRYIKMTVNADDETKEQAYNDYFANIYAPAEAYQFKIKKRFYESPVRTELESRKYSLLNQIFSNDIKLFREENIPLMIQESELANKYAGIVSKMSAIFEGEEKTPAQLSVYLKDPDRNKRENAWRLRMNMFAEKQEELNKLYSDLIALRHQIAVNVDFSNYRDFKHQEMGRFSYTPEELFAFHKSVEKVVMPFIAEQNKKRKEALKLDTLRPWDTAVDLDGRILKPFETTEEFINKSLKVLYQVNPEYAMQLEKMKNTGLLDLENRKGKAPGGYNSSINNLASSFIFMNYVKIHNDIVTLLHESGHAMHSAAMANIKIAQYLETPSEVAELASMTMELLTMDYWDEFYSNPEDLKKAKRDQLEGTLSFLPWCMTVDALQHWVYLHPEHSVKERYDAFVDIHKRFSAGVDWTGLENYRKILWTQQLHIFEVPFYYIEYGMAQLGALSIYMNYRQDKQKALQQYQDFLNLGYTKSVKDIYKTAGISFDFSEDRIYTLVNFVREELEKLED